MRTVIKVDGEPKEETALRPIEFTHYLDISEGWDRTEDNPLDFDKIIYLGKCHVDGDMFAAYEDDCISIFKGHLNDGVY